MGWRFVPLVVAQVSAGGGLACKRGRAKVTRLGHVADGLKKKLHMGRSARSSRAFMSKTFIICKPDCMVQKHVGDVISRFEKEGFKIIGCKMIRLTPALLREHYAHVADRPFYPSIEAFMSSEPVVMLALSGDNVVARVRELLGPTDSRKAAKGTIRGDFGTDMQTNVVHASDSDENAAIELARFFKTEELYG